MTPAIPNVLIQVNSIGFKNLMAEYAYSTDCQLATLEGYAMRKSIGKGDLSRQEEICHRMLQVLCQFPDTYWIKGNRASRLILQAREDIQERDRTLTMQEALGAVLTLEVERIKGNFR